MLKERQNYTLRMPPEMGKALADMAKNECMPKNSFIIQLLKKGMKEYEQKNR